MTSEKEKTVRKMFQNRVPLEDIIDITRLKKRTVKSYILAIKKGFKSYKEYLDSSSQNRGFENSREEQFKRHGFEKQIDLKNARAREQGYASFYDYQNAKAKEKGYKNAIDRNNALAREKGFKSATDIRILNNRAREAGFKNHYDRENEIAKAKGYSGISEYRKLSNENFAKEQGFNSAREMFNHKTQQRFEKSIKIQPLSHKKLTINSNPLEYEELTKQIYSIINQLSEKEQTVINNRFFSNQSYHKIGESIGITYQRVQQIEKESLKKLQYKAKQAGLDLYLEYL